MAKRFLWRGSSADAIVGSCVMKAQFINPVFQAQRLRSNSNQEVVPLVTSLLPVGGPLAVIRRVIPFVVYSLNGITRPWASADVSNKRLERGPAVTDPNPTCTVVFKLRVFRITAALMHSLPSIVFSRSPSNPGLAVLSEPLRRLLEIQASATFRYAGPQVVANDTCHCATLAAAQPHQFPYSSTSLLSKREHEPSGKCLTCKIYEYTHSLNYKPVEAAA